MKLKGSGEQGASIFFSVSFWLQVPVGNASGLLGLVFLPRLATWLGHHFFEDAPSNIRQPKVSAGMVVSQLFMVDPQEGKKGGMEVDDRNRILGRLNPMVATASVREACANRATGHPESERLMVVIASVIPLCIRGSAELTAPHDQGIFQHPATIQILKKSRDRPVDSTAVARQGIA